MSYRCVGSKHPGLIHARSKRTISTSSLGFTRRSRSPTSVAERKRALRRRCHWPLPDSQRRRKRAVRGRGCPSASHIMRFDTGRSGRSGSGHFLRQTGSTNDGANERLPLPATTDTDSRTSDEIGLIKGESSVEIPLHNFGRSIVRQRQDKQLTCPCQRYVGQSNLLRNFR